MARIAGVNIPSAKRIEVALTYIFGIGRKSAQDICAKSGIDVSRRVNDLSDEEIMKIREVIDGGYLVEGELRREVATAASDIVKVCRFAVRAPNKMLVPAKVSVRQLRIRRNSEGANG